ncbi:HAD hydrolase family protein [Candidatus Woesearchaeota archaeon]|nr:HAD hydrolase family protein [Candidatus Woesearchaeota archaeon]
MSNYKLICFDMDGVLFKAHNFWMQVHKTYGTFEKGRKLTDQYLLTDYAKLVQKVVVELWMGRPAKPYNELVNSIKYFDNVLPTLKEIKKRDYLITIITCGPKELVGRLVKDGAPIDYSYYNELVIENSKVSGKFEWPVAEGHMKKVYLLNEICKKVNINLTHVIGVADGKSDEEMMEACGKRIAFCPTSEKIRELADVIIEKDDLSEILKYV